MKLKLILPWLLVCLAFTFSLNGQNHLNNIHSVVPQSSFIKAEKAISPVAQRAMDRGEKPGQFKNVTHSFTSRVQQLTAAQKSIIQQSMAADGLTKASELGSFHPDPDKIYVDPETDLIMQFDPIADDDLLVYRPKIHHVFETFTIPEQEVEVNLANTSSTIDNSKVSSSNRNGEYDMVMSFDSIPYTFKEGNTTFNVTLVGDIKFANPRIVGHYSKNNGYKLVFKAKENIDLKVYSDLKYKKEISKPLWGFKIKAGDYGECNLGIFLVVSIDGKVSLVVDVDQGFDIEAGVKGNTFYYVPTKIRPVIEINNWCDIDYELSGEITAFAGVQCQTKLKIKGYDALDIKVKGGVEGTVETDGTFLSADLGMRIKAYGKVVSKSFTLLDKYYSIYQTRQKDYGNYNMQILEACAYRDYVVGRITTKDTKEPYNGPLKIYLKPINGNARTFDTQTNNNGYFCVSNIPMMKGDKVAIGLTQSPNLSDYATPTIPFSEITLNYADYYTNTVHGTVAGKISLYEDLIRAYSTSTNNNSHNANVATINNSTVNKVKVYQPNQTTISRLTQFRNSLIVYKGKLEVIKQNKPTAVPINASSTKQKTYKTPQSGNSTKPKRYFTQVSSPLGSFMVNNIDLSPMDKVKAKIIVEGFEVYSSWLMCDGLQLTSIEVENTQSSINLDRLTINGDNAFTIISALRSDKTPSGSVRLVKGIDYQHHSVTQPYQQVNGFDELQKPMVWFDKTVSLNPMENDKGTGLANTGSWSSTIRFSSPSELINPFNKGGHAFEMVSFAYEGHALGHKTYQDECHGCNSPIDYINNLKSNSFGFNHIKMNKQIKIPAKAPKQQIKIQQGAIKH